MRDPQEIDRWLDEALANFAHVEPRPGLEDRMLVRLASEKRGTMRWWAFAMSAAAVAVVLVWWHPHLEIVPPPDVHWTANLPPPLPIHGTPPSGAEERVRASAHLRNAAEARHERFPSPSPLTDQEKLLARFVQDFPQRAAVVAQAQTELYKQEQKEMARPWPGKEND